MQSLIIECSEGKTWYVSYQDSMGRRRYLPTKRKFFGRKWTLDNCPREPDKNCLAVSDGRKHISIFMASTWLKKHYPNAETYLKKLNGKELILPNFEKLL